MLTQRINTLVGRQHSLSITFLVVCVLLSALGGVLLGIGWYLLLPVIVLPLLLFISYQFVDVDRASTWIAYLGGLAFFTFVLWPRYGYLKLGGLPGVTPPRLVFLLLAFLFLSAIFKSRLVQQIFYSRWRDSGLIVSVLGIYFFFRTGSAIFSDAPFSSLLSLVNEVVFLGCAFVVGLLVIRDQFDVRRFAWLVVFSTFIVSMLAIVEYFLQKNLFLGILPVSDEYAQDAIFSKIRDGGYRAQSTFDHPLTFSQYLNTVIPVVVILAISEHTLKAKFFSFSVAVLALIAMVLTGSRSALFVLAVGLFFLAATMSVSQFVTRRVTISGLLVVVAVLASFFGAALGVGDYLVELLMGRSSAEVSSTSARLIMLQRAIPLVIDSPLLGHGVGTAAELIGFVGGRGILTIDSLLISISVDSGLPAVLSYLGLVAVGVFTALRSLAQGTEGRLLGAGFAAGVFAFGLTTVTLSLTANWFLFASFLAAGCAAGTKVKPR